MRRLWRLVVASAERFYDDHCFMRASALAYASLLSVVPLLAVMFAVLKGLGVQHRLEPLLLSRLSLQAETTDAIIGYIDRTNFSTLGAFGGVTLVLTIYSLLGSVEASFNHIWRVRQDRGYAQQLTHYFGVVLLTPFLLLTAVTLTSFFQVEQMFDWARGSAILGEALVAILAFVPIVMNILALAVLYAVMPNRRPFWPSVWLGAVAAGVAWHIVQVAYLRLQIGVARYNAIYGALSQVPVTLVWQYVSWLVVLAGAEIAAVIELGIDPRRRAAAAPTGWAMAVELLVQSRRAFETAGTPVSLTAVARAVRVPLDVMAAVADRLVDRGWLALVQDRSDEVVLAVASQHIHLGDLADLFEATATSTAGCSAEVQRLAERLAVVQQAAWKEWSLADLVVEPTSPLMADVK